MKILEKCSEKRAAKHVGRPRDFDIDKALDSALQVFWTKGYEGTSLSDLTEAMNINRPSLYAAFGNKEDLFLKALDRYGAKMGCAYEALNEPKAYDAVEKLFLGLADAQTDSCNPRGCLMINGAIACSETADTIRKELITRRALTEVKLRERFERAEVENDLPKGTTPAELARYFATVMQGMSVQASGGASREDLREIARTALRVWAKN